MAQNELAALTYSFQPTNIQTAVGMRMQILNLKPFLTEQEE